MLEELIEKLILDELITGTSMGYEYELRFSNSNYVSITYVYIKLRSPNGLEIKCSGMVFEQPKYSISAVLKGCRDFDIEWVKYQHLRLNIVYLAMKIYSVVRIGDSETRGIILIEGFRPLPIFSSKEITPIKIDLDKILESVDRKEIDIPELYSSPIIKSARN